MNKLPQEVLNDIASYLGTEPRPGPTSKSHWATRELQDERVRSRSCLVGLASLSNELRIAAERITFSYLSINATELAEFENLMFGRYGDDRRAALCDLCFSIEVPELDDDSQGLPQDLQAHREANERTASEAMSRLLDMLARWGPATDGTGPQRGIRLRFHIHTPRGTQQESDEEDGYATGQYTVIERNEMSYIRLRNLPTRKISCVRDLVYSAPDSQEEYGGIGLRKLHPASLVALSDLFIQLRSCYLALAEIDEKHVRCRGFHSLRRKIHRELYQAINNSLGMGPTAEELFIMLDPFPSHDLRLLDMTDGTNADPLCAAIHDFMARSHFVFLAFAGRVDAELFWPTRAAPAGAVALSSLDGLGRRMPGLPYWSSIRRLSVYFGPDSPSGQWYFRGREGRDSDEPLPAGIVGHQPPTYEASELFEGAAATATATTPADSDTPWLPAEPYPRYEEPSYFRVVPDGQVMNPLLAAYARCLTKMEHLERAALFTKLDPSDQGSRQSEWGVYYFGRGQWDHAWESFSIWHPPSEPRVTFRTHGWMPSREVLSLFKSVRADCSGFAVSRHEGLCMPFSWPAST
ncbi:hypothetical protein RB597_002770 [Gaeumannomyces tritici]